jgi:hypothetical protein
MATALLAGGFAPAARPFLAARRGLRALAMIWLGQNVPLCVSAAMRLGLYVDAYGLTYLRIHAGILIGLVAVGLALTGWQIWRRRSGLWLLARIGGLGLGALYVSCFVNFAHVIAEENLARGRLDPAHLRSLGPMASAAVAAAWSAAPCGRRRRVVRRALRPACACDRRLA